MLSKLCTDVLTVDCTTDNFIVDPQLNVLVAIVLFLLRPLRLQHPRCLVKPVPAKGYMNGLAALFTYRMTLVVAVVVVKSFDWGRKFGSHTTQTMKVCSNSHDSANTTTTTRIKRRVLRMRRDL